MPHEFRIRRSVNTYALHQHDPEVKAFRTLCPIASTQTGHQFIVMGTLEDFQTYELMPLLFSNANLELPHQAPPPAIAQTPLANNLQALLKRAPAEAQTMILRIVLGHASKSSLMGELLRQTEATLAKYGYVMQAPSSLSPSVHLYNNLRSELPTPDHPYYTYAYELANLDYPREIGVIYRASLEDAARRTRMRDPLLGVAKLPRRSWPWAKMLIGDTVFIELDQTIRAQRAVHAYAASSHKKFTTFRDANRNMLAVTRDA